MFCGKSSFTKMEQIHPKARKIIFNRDGSYVNVLTVNNEVSLLQKHLTLFNPIDFDHGIVRS